MISFYPVVSKKTIVSNNLLHLCQTLKTYTMPKLKDEQAKQLFNWGEISRMLSGTRSVIRKNSIPKVHQPIITEMIDAVGDILKRNGYV